MSRGFEQLRGLVRGQVSVAAAELVAGELLPSAITKFQATHPYVRFHVRIGAPEELVEALVADQVDLILTHDAPRKKGVAIVAVARQALCAMVVPDHPLASRDELRLRDCLAFPLALADTSLAGRGLIEQVLANASFDLDPRLVSNSVETMKAFAHMNCGVCFQFRSPGKASDPAWRHDGASAGRSATVAGAIAAGDTTKPCPPGRGGFVCRANQECAGMKRLRRTTRAPARSRGRGGRSPALSGAPSGGSCRSARPNRCRRRCRRSSARRHFPAACG